MKNATRFRWVLLLGAALCMSVGLSPATARAQAEGTDDSEGEDSGGEAEVEGEGAADAADATGADESAADDEIEVDDGHDEIEAPEGLGVAQTEEPAEGTLLSAPTADEAAADPTEAEEAAAEGESAEEEEDAAPAAEPLPWRNTFFSWTNQVSFNSFLRDAQLSYDPNYSQLFTLSPRWYVAPTTFFWASTTLSVELTDGEGTVYNREPQIADTVVELRHMIPWEGFVFIGQARVGLPTSKISIAAQRYLQLGLGLTAVAPIPDIGLTLAGVFSYRRWLAGSNVVQVGEPQPDNCLPPPAATVGDGTSAPELNSATCDQLGTVSAASDVLLYGLALTWVPFAAFNVSLSAFMFTTHGFELAPAYINVDTREDPLRIDDGSPSHWNNFTYISLSVGYQFLPWLNVALGIQNSGIIAPAYNPDGSIRNPIFTPDTQVFLSATFQVDEVWNQIAGSGEDDLTPEERQRRRQGLASGPRTGGSF